MLDKRLDGSLRTLIYPVPGLNDPGLGIHLTPTVDGNILIGPSAQYLGVGGKLEEEREDYRGTAAIMTELRREGLRLLPGLCASDFIRSFSGNRPKQTPPEKGGNADFTISGPEYAYRYIERLRELEISVMHSTIALELSRDKRLLVSSFFPTPAVCRATSNSALWTTEFRFISARR